MELGTHCSIDIQSLSTLLVLIKTDKQQWNDIRYLSYVLQLDSALHGCASVRFIQRNSIFIDTLQLY